jgi:hypothetical protein
VHQPQQGLHCISTVVGSFASLPEDLPLITQATAALTRVNAYPRKFVPQNNAVTLSLLVRWAMLSTDQEVAFLYALQAQTPVEQAKICTDLAAKQQM